MALVTKGNPEDSMADDEKPDERPGAKANQPEDQGPDREDTEERDERAVARAGAPAAAPSGGFLSVYKPGQGYWTRMATAGALIAILAYTGQFIYSSLKYRAGLETKWAILTVAVLAVAAIVIGWRYLNKPNIVDFFVATESEMKKVNWTSKKDLIGSTKVVIVFMLLIAGLLFLIDIAFGYFFYVIKVLKHGPFA
jgi:preprotein translocase subunit SecE